MQRDEPGFWDDLWVVLLVVALGVLLGALFDFIRSGGR